MFTPGSEAIALLFPGEETAGVAEIAGEDMDFFRTLVRRGASTTGDSCFGALLLLGFSEE